MLWPVLLCVPWMLWRLRWKLGLYVNPPDVMKSTVVGAIVCSSALALADDATPAAEQEVPLVVTPSKAVNTVGVESR